VLLLLLGLRYLEGRARQRVSSDSPTSPKR
jgi:hypothetical protein